MDIADKQNISAEIKKYTSAKLQFLLTCPSESQVRASLARLRRGIGHAPGEIPELWGEYLLDLPQTLTGYNEPSHAEWAIYIVLTMFALHQQGRDLTKEPMHRKGNSLGTAARKLMESEDDRERISRRFYPVATAANMEALSHHLRGLVTLLRSEGIPMDYVRLSSDLYFFQNPDTADRVRLRWGEDFCCSFVDTNIEKNTENNTVEKG